jgi:hypothetical protein
MWEDIMLASLAIGIVFLLCFLGAILRESRPDLRPLMTAGRHMVVLAGWRKDVPALFPVSRSAHQVEKETARRSASSRVAVLTGRESGMRRHKHA